MSDQEKSDENELDVKALEKDLLGDVKTSFDQMGKNILTGKMAEHKLFMESAQEGGPVNTHQAIVNLMEHCNVGIRHLARVTGVKRKLLLGMIHGRNEMPHEILSKIYDVFKNRQPDLFKFDSHDDKLDFTHEQH